MSQLQFKLQDERNQTKSQQHLAFIRDITSTEANLRFTKGTISHKALKWAYHVAKGERVDNTTAKFLWEVGARKSIVTVTNHKQHIAVNIKAA